MGELMGEQSEASSSGKWLLPLSVRLFSIRRLTKIPYFLEVVGCCLQSKRGSGSGSELQEVTNAVHFIHRPNPLIFDVGANVGRWTLAILRKFPSDWKPEVVMFEPQAQCWPELEGLLAANVTLVKSAVSNNDGTLTFFHGGRAEITGASAHQPLGFKGLANKTEVSSIRLDTYVRSNNVKFVDFIKMDIEGHEIEAIKGADETLAQGLIGAISFEFGPANVNSRTFFIDFFDRLTAYQFVIYRMGHDGVPIKISQYGRSLEYFDGVANYVAAREPPQRYR